VKGEIYYIKPNGRSYIDTDTVSVDTKCESNQSSYSLGNFVFELFPPPISPNLALQSFFGSLQVNHESAGPPLLKSTLPALVQLITKSPL